MTQDDGGAGRAEPLTDPSVELVRAMLRVAPRLMRLEAQVLSELPTPLTHRQFRILARIGDGATSPTSISRRSNVSLAAIAESIGVLVERGLIDRRPDVADGRAHRLTLTASGRRSWQAAERAVVSICADVATRLPPSVPTASTHAVEQVRLAIDARSDPVTSED